MIREATFSKALTLLLFFCLGSLMSQDKIPQKSINIFNPSIGLGVDLLTTLDSVVGQRSVYSGLQARGVELIIGSAVDPYADLSAIFLFSLGGVEIHDLSISFPYLGKGFKLQLGRYFPHFNRLNQIHAHALATVSDSLVYERFNGGKFLMNGLTMSWRIPISFYLNVELSVYDGFSGDFHDILPENTHTLRMDFDIDAIASQLGLVDKHGSGESSHWHDPNDGNVVVTFAEVVRRARDMNISVGNSPEGYQVLDDLAKLVYGVNLSTSLDFNDTFSLDFGLSALYRNKHLRSLRFPGMSYQKLYYGIDLTFFIHPPRTYKKQDFIWAFELLGIYQVQEYFEDAVPRALAFNRLAFHNHINLRVHPSLSVGLLADVFQKNNVYYLDGWDYRLGVFAKLNLSHFQYIGLEYNYYDFNSELEDTHRLMLQYDVVIGDHEHGFLR